MRIVTEREGVFVAKGVSETKLARLFITQSNLPDNTRIFHFDNRFNPDFSPQFPYSVLVFHPETMRDGYWADKAADIEISRLYNPSKERPTNLFKVWTSSRVPVWDLDTSNEALDRVRGNFISRTIKSLVKPKPNTPVEVVLATWYPEN